jgi:hypothetical protein
MQILLNWHRSDEAYVSQRGWETATLEACPFHPEGGCGLERLGSYGRVEPAGIRIARWWCPTAGQSISLLPSFLSARFPGTLAEVEDVVARVEAAGSVAAVVDAVHPADAEDAIGLASALRSIRRRVKAISAALRAITTLFVDRFVGVDPTIAALRDALGFEPVLVTVRVLAASHLRSLPAPLGFRTRAEV